MRERKGTIYSRETPLDKLTDHLEAIEFKI